MDRKVWLSQRARLRRQLESFGDVKTWLENKPSITPSEAKVLLMIRHEQKASEDTFISIRRPKVRSPDGQKMLRLWESVFILLSFIRQDEMVCPFSSKEQKQVPKGRCMSSLSLHSQYPSGT